MPMTLEDLKRFIEERPFYIIEKVLIGGKIFLIDNNGFVHLSQGCFPVDIPLKKLPNFKLGEP